MKQSYYYTWNPKPSDIRSIYHKYIKTVDGREYHKALYGDFIVIMIKSNDYRNGYMNATKLCNKGGKEFFHWKRLEKLKELIEYCENRRASDLKPVSESLFLLDLHSYDTDDKLIAGTYLHPRLIVHVAIWISNENTLYCSRLQKKSHNNTTKVIKGKYPNAEEILVLEDVPNAINLFNKVKTELGGDLISVTRNITTLIDIEEAEFLLRVNEIFNERDY